MKTKNYYGLMAMAMMTAGCTQEADDFGTEKQGATEWTTDVTVTARDGEDNILGTATITGAPFKANRAMTYSGNLFCWGTVRHDADRRMGSGLYRQLVKMAACT